MNKKVKKLKKFIYTHQLESIMAIVSIVLLIVGFVSLGWPSIFVVALIDLVIFLSPKVLDLFKDVTDKASNKDKKIKSNGKKVSSKSNTKESLKKNGSSKKEEKKGFKKWLKIFLLICLIGFIVGIVAVIIFFVYIVINAPDFNPDNLYKQESSILYFSDGSEMAKIGSENREKISYDEISPKLVDAIVATEDSRFWKHNGFDLPRFLKASFGQLLGQSSAGGASTLTMQVSKNAFTSTESSGFQGVVRKFTDIYLAVFQIEKKYTKEEIMEFYVNSYYMGGGAYGVEQASLNYFGKHASELSLTEAATIAGLFQSPGKYDLFKYPENAEARRNIVLKLMVRHGYINQKEADEAASVPINDLLRNQSNDEKNNDYQGAIDTVVEEIKSDLDVNPYAVSMEIYTTIDKRVQDVINDAMTGKTYTWENNVVTAGVSVINTQNGSIAGVGTGRNTSSALGFNNVTQTNRQIGSTAKPLFDYAPGIEYNNNSTFTLLGDENYTYSDGTNVTNYDGGYKGLVTSRYALQDSRNIPALKVFQSVKKSNILEMVKNLGLHPEIDKQSGSIHEAHAIGGYTGESPLSVSSAYAAFANGGYHTDPYSYTKIVYRETGEEYEQKINRKRAMSEETAFMVESMLESVSQGSIHNFSNNIIRKKYGAKTGTSNFAAETKRANGLPDNAINDLWITGVTDEYSISVWYGYDKIYKDHFTQYGNIQHLYLFSTIAKDVWTRDTNVPQPAGVVQATVEAETIDPQLPSPYTPGNLKVTEYFKKGTEPTTVSNRFAQLNNASGVTAKQVGNQVEISWSKASEPEVATTKYLNEYFGKAFRSQSWINTYTNNRLGYIRGTMGQFGYYVYEKSASGLRQLGFTTDNSYSYTPTESGTCSYLVKTSYSSFTSNQASGTTSNSISVKGSGGNDDVSDDTNNDDKKNNN